MPFTLSTSRGHTYNKDKDSGETLYQESLVGILISSDKVIVTLINE